MSLMLVMTIMMEKFVMLSSGYCSFFDVRFPFLLTVAVTWFQGVMFLVLGVGWEVI